MTPGSALAVNAVMNNMIQTVPSIFNNFGIRYVYDEIQSVCRATGDASTDPANVSMLTNKVLNKLYFSHKNGDAS